VLIAVVGPATCDDNVAAVAQALGREIALRGAMLVCGGRGGVMEAACQGAQAAGGVTVGILPGEDRGQANAYLDVPIVTGLGEARNTIVVRTADAVIAVSGGYGTLSEIGFALKMGRPVIGLRTWELSQGGCPVEAVVEAGTPAEAVELALMLSSRVPEQEGVDG
jgi:uncharacterized protein (TIGR00725 family)